MNTVVLTDGKYRSAIAAARAFGRAGYRVIVTRTAAEGKRDPPVFFSKYAEGIRIEGSVRDPEYPERLLALLGRYDAPVLFPVGAATLNVVADNRERFAEAARFLIPDKAVLDALNDKQTVQHRAGELGIPTPTQYEGTPERFPVVIKPHCGERLGLKAAERYVVAQSAGEFAQKYAAVAALDPSPIVQERVSGEGNGASLLLGADSELLCAICHRRIREYPMSGGPSTCCVSEYDAARIDAAYRLLRSFGFVGAAMVEFKGEYLLEVNPRVWGSFPLTVFCGSPFCEKYAAAALGEPVRYTPRDYEAGKKMRFLVNDLAASADLLRHGRFRDGLQGLCDLFRVPEALKDPEDKKAYRKYIRSYLKL